MCDELHISIDFNAKICYNPLVLIREGMNHAAEFYGVPSGAAIFSFHPACEDAGGGGSRHVRQSTICTASCEIYINLSGDVSFMVEEKIYPIRPGDAILTRPYEYHHCIYHSDAPHEHFWILFSAEGNEALFPLFFCRGARRREPHRTSHEKSKRACLVIAALCSRAKAALWRAISIFLPCFRCCALGTGAEEESAQVPEELRRVLEYINVNYAGPIAVGALAEMAFVSRNTLERRFQQYLGVSPYAYITEKRLTCSLHLLLRGASVAEACARSGFSDCSQFIAKFRRKFGATPHQYIRLKNPPGGRA